MLGVTAFGGPVAHLAYFREAFVVRRQWMTDARYANLLALTQMLPGPASSQLGFLIGLHRAGWAGALAAFVAFTAPSAVLLVAFAHVAPRVAASGTGAAVLHGLKLVAVAVVAHALLGMARRLTPDVPRVLIAALAGALVLRLDSAWWQLAAIVLGGAAMLVVRAAGAGGSVGGSAGGSAGDLAGESADDRAAIAVGATVDAPVGTTVGTTVGPTVGAGAGPVSRRTGAWLLAIAAALLGLSLLAAPHGGLVALLGGFVRAGALVFGGGHVVLPLLEEVTVSAGVLSADQFLAGYGAAQAVPGPLFSLAAYLGAVACATAEGVACGATWVPGTGRLVIGALAGTVALFLPGFLIAAGVLPFWERLQHRPRLAHTMLGVNAAVVGILAAALWRPVISTSVAHWSDGLIAVVGFVLLQWAQRSALWVVAWCVFAAWLARVLHIV